MPRSASLPLRLALLVTAFVATGCTRDDDTRGQSAGDDAAPGGTIIISQPEADAMVPLLAAGEQGKMVTDLMFERLAEIGPALNTIGDGGFRPRLARRWTWAPDSLSIAFEIDPRARWHDGRPVRARDVQFTVELYRDPAVGSPHSANFDNIDSVTVRDSLTAVVWYGERRPEQFFDITYNMTPVPEHLLRDVPRAQLAASDYARRPVGSGRFRIGRSEPGQRLELVADTASFLGRPKVDRIVIIPLTDFAVGPTRLLAGEVDVVDKLRPENLTEIAKNPNLRIVRYAGSDYAFMQFNLNDRARSRPHPIFGDRELRRALTMALDRPAMVKSALGDLAVPAIGPTTHGSSVADTTIPQLPYDTARAARTLDSLGWRDANGDGVRERNGRPLRFTLLVPSISKSRMAYGTLIQEQLRQVGVRVDVEPIDFNAFLQREAKRDFDAVLGAWHTDPSLGSVRQTWTSAGANENGSNYGSYRSPVFDAHVDSALSSYDPATTRRHMRAAHATMIEDAAVVWLYELRPAMGMHKRIRTPALRPDAWWADVGEWYIPVGERLPRDRTQPAAR